MLKVIVIEDEALVQKDILGLLRFIGNIEVTHVIDNVKEALQILPTANVDLVLLDIHLKDGTAFDLLSKLNELEFHIIFITAHEQYAINAIKIGALDYLLKPVDLEELKLAINKIKEEPIDKKQIDLTIEATKSSINKLIVKNTDGIHFITFNELMYCKGEGPYTTFYTNDYKSVMTSKPLKEYEKILPSLSFIRCHQSYIVNKSYIKKINKDDYLELNNDIMIPISSRKRDTVIKEMLL